MIEEGTNPILEGGPAIAANVQDMLLQDFIVVRQCGQHLGFLITRCGSSVPPHKRRGANYG